MQFCFEPEVEGGKIRLDMARHEILDAIDRLEWLELEGHLTRGMHTEGVFVALSNAIDHITGRVDESDEDEEES